MTSYRSVVVLSTAAAAVGLIELITMKNGATLALVSILAVTIIVIQMVRKSIVEMTKPQ